MIERWLDGDPTTARTLNDIGKDMWSKLTHEQFDRLLAATTDFSQITSYVRAYLIVVGDQLDLAFERPEYFRKVVKKLINDKTCITYLNIGDIAQYPTLLSILLEEIDGSILAELFACSNSKIFFLGRIERSPEFRAEGEGGTNEQFQAFIRKVDKEKFKRALSAIFPTGIYSLVPEPEPSFLHNAFIYQELDDVRILIDCLDEHTLGILCPYLYKDKSAFEYAAEHQDPSIVLSLLLKAPLSLQGIDHDLRINQIGELLKSKGDYGVDVANVFLNTAQFVRNPRYSIKTNPIEFIDFCRGQIKKKMHSGEEFFNREAWINILADAIDEVKNEYSAQIVEHRQTLMTLKASVEATYLETEYEEEKRSRYEPLHVSGNRNMILPDENCLDVGDYFALQAKKTADELTKKRYQLRALEFYGYVLAENAVRPSEPEESKGLDIGPSVSSNDNPHPMAIAFILDLMGKPKPADNNDEWQLAKFTPQDISLLKAKLSIDIQTLTTEKDEKEYQKGLDEMKKYLDKRKPQTRNWVSSTFFGYDELDYVVRESFYETLTRQSTWKERASIIDNALNHPQIKNGILSNNFADKLKNLQKIVNRKAAAPRLHPN